MQEPIEIKPSTERTAQDLCGSVSIYVDDHGTWIASGRDDKSRCFAPRKGAELDHAWLEAQLRKLKTNPCGPTAAELAASDSVRYQEVIATMDIAVKTGFVDVGLSTADKLAVPLASASTKGAASDCPPSLIPYTDEDRAAMAQPRPEPARGSNGLAQAPVLVITKDKLTFNSKDVMTVAEAAKGSGKIEALIKMLPPTRDGMLILQADQDTPTTVINRVVITAKAGGYDNLLFAVKNK
jgi:biopolymer transport protein ExbD